MKNQILQEIGTGLQALKEDPRDLSLGGMFGTIDLKDIPLTDFNLSRPLFRKDQGSLDFCTAYAVTEASEDQEQVELDPHFQFAVSCKLRGNYADWGCDLRVAVSSATKVGSIELADRPALMEGKSRDDLANWENWPAYCFELAKKHQKESYYNVKNTVRGNHDLFDDIRGALWAHKDETRTVVVGAKWRQAWTDAPGGMVPLEYNDEGFGHAFKFYDQKVIDGVIHLVAQLSNGQNIGDNGDYYFRREVVNKEFPLYGQFMFKDLPAETAKIYAKNGISTQTNLLYRLFILIIHKLKNI